MRTRRAGQSALLLLDAVAVLEGEVIEYAVIGAMAAAIHGSLRATTDADALLSIPVAKLPSLSRAFEKAGFTAALRRGDADDPIPAVLLVSDTHGNRVDLLGGLRGLDHQVFARAIEIPFEGSTLRVVSCEDFIAMKCFAGRPQDIVDAKHALGSVQAIDLDLVRRVVRGFGRPAADVLEQILGGSLATASLAGGMTGDATLSLRPEIAKSNRT
jgi:predicted nucleotidyltransferase